MTDTTKAMSLQECKDEVAKKHNWSNWNNLCFVWAGFGKMIEPYANEAAELYKDSCLSSYKAELRGKIEALYGDHLPEDYKLGLDKVIELIGK